MSGHVPDVAIGSLTRRRFLGSAGAGALAAAMIGCERRGGEHIVPAVRRAPESIPGTSVPYATAALRDGQAIGLLVESRDGRPIKIEGHPDHPASLGGTGAQEQALLLGLYDADRVEALTSGGQPRAASDLMDVLGPRAPRRFVAGEGDGLALWIGETSSAIRARAIEHLRHRFPRARVTFDAAGVPQARWEGSRLAFARVLEPVIDPSRLDRLVVLDGDPFGAGPQALAVQRRWARARKARGTELTLVVIEPSPTVTGIAADERYPADDAAIAAVVLALLARVTSGVAAQASETPPWLDRLVRTGERTAFVLGDAQPAWMHAAVHALNEAHGAYGADGAISLVPSPLLGADEDPRSFDRAPLLDALGAGEIDTLITEGTNPAYSLPSAARWPELRSRVGVHVHVASFHDETAAGADWIVPEAHVLERWGEARAFDGTITTLQPLIEPLHGGKTLEEIIDVLLGRPREDGRARLARALGVDAVALAAVLERGFVEGSAFSPVRVAVDMASVRDAIGSAPVSPREAWSVHLIRDARVDDGRFAENAWLQELPDPITKLAWGNAARLAPADCDRLDVEDGDVIEVTAAGARVRIPVIAQPGQAPGVITIPLGYGRRAGGRRARGIGVAVNDLRTAPTTMRASGASVARTGDRVRLAIAQIVDTSEERPRELEREGVLDPPSFYPDWPSDGVQWGMAIDLDVCTGCSACVVACQAENDVPVVGPDQVALGRSMHWLRIDRYYAGSADSPRVELQPMMCQHCEHAPCEYVCPTHATVHSPDGLNEMVYNRCVGTRFCSNNCPYKVRRFNWFDFWRDAPAIEQLALNPDVTVRGRGVMEKCTYCVQRIRRAQIVARAEERPLRDGEVVSACMQACPSEAIVFGQVSDPESLVSRMHADDRAYAELGELGTRPRTRYLRRRAQSRSEGGA